VTYSITDMPTGAFFNQNTFTWTPGYNQAGVYPVTFVVSDGELTDEKTVSITVSNVNRVL